MARKRSRIFPVILLATGLVVGWWLARQDLPGLKELATTAVSTSASGNIHRVDFQNFTYTPDCLSADGKSASVPVRKGSYRLEQEYNQIYFVVLAVQYGDLTGDGQDEAVVATSCNLGGTGQFTEGMLFSMRENQPVLLARVAGGDRAYGGIEGLSIDNGRLIVERFATDDGPACCPAYIETTVMRWDGTRLVTDGASTRRAAPAQ